MKITLNEFVVHMKEQLDNFQDRAMKNIAVQPEDDFEDWLEIFNTLLQPPSKEKE